MLESYDCHVERTIPAEELLDQTPGTMLRGARYREDMTQVQLAEVSGIPRRHISDMENNRRPIGKQAARKLAEVPKVDYRVFL
jgi:transcriptional regulator with XRE-family HTH domain